MRIAVAGGTGLVGRYVVSALEGAGHEPVVLARSVGVDLTTGAGLAEALAGVEAVIDCSNVNAASEAASQAFFGTAARNLAAASAAAGVGHLVVLSIVGIDRVPLGYYAGKVLQERVYLTGPVPATVLRATQFHEFPGQVLARMRGPVAFVPSMRTQPVAAREVAEVLVELAQGAPARGTVELAGPRVERLADMGRKWLRANGSRKRVVPMWLPGEAFRGMRTGGLLPAGEHRAGRQTFAEWLAGPDRTAL